MTTGNNEEAIRQWAANAEDALAANFSTWVGSLDLGRLVVAEDARLDRHTLTPITAEPSESFPSSLMLGHYFTLPPGVIIKKSPHNKTFLETAYAIGLTYENESQEKELQGVAAGCIVLDTLLIKQIQGTVGPHSAGHYYGRFAWQDPLVKGWIDIGQKLGASQISILGAKNNRWLLDVGFVRLRNELRKAGKAVPERKTDLTKEQAIEALGKGVEALVKNYDEVANRLGFDQQPDRNWYLPLTGNA